MFLMSSKNGKVTLELVTENSSKYFIWTFSHQEIRPQGSLLKYLKFSVENLQKKEIKKKIPKTSHIWIQEIVLNKLQKPNKRMSKKDMAIKA